MTYSVVYSSKTGNTRMLAEAIRSFLPNENCTYMGEPSSQALVADRIYVGFWTDKGTCDPETAAFLSELTTQEVFLFGTAGFGGTTSYFETILRRVSGHLHDSAQVIGTYMCQGKMPVSVRTRYEKMLASPDHAPNLPMMIENFDRALSHPDADDLAQLKEAVHKAV